jgi:phenylacetate-CoA ligase
MPYFNEAVETMPRGALREVQTDKFKALLVQLWEQNRFYTDKLGSAGIMPADFQSLDDLSGFPFTTKAELLCDQEENPPFGTNTTFSEEAYTRFHQTSGTTGTPLRVLDTVPRASVLGILGVQSQGVMVRT